MLSPALLNKHLTINSCTSCGATQNGERYCSQCVQKLAIARLPYLLRVKK